MNAHGTATSTALAMNMLFLQKNFDSLAGNLPKVVNKTVIIVLLISFIEMPESFTGKPLALETILDFPFRNEVTIAFQIGTLLISWSAPNAMGNRTASFRDAF